MKGGAVACGRAFAFCAAVARGGWWVALVPLLRLCRSALAARWALWAIAVHLAPQCHRSRSRPDPAAAILLGSKEPPPPIPDAHHSTARFVAPSELGIGT